MHRFYLPLKLKFPSVINIRFILSFRISALVYTNTYTTQVHAYIYTHVPKQNYYAIQSFLFPTVNELYRRSTNLTRVFLRILLIRCQERAR